MPQRPEPVACYAECMSLLHLVVILIVVGVLLFLINAIKVIDGNIKVIINAVVIVCVCVWLLEVFGAFSGPLLGSPHLHAPR